MASSVIQHPGQLPIGFRNLGRLCLRCRCFCNQNIRAFNNGSKTLSSSSRATSTWSEFPLSFLVLSLLLSHYFPTLFLMPTNRLTIMLSGSPLGAALNLALKPSQVWHMSGWLGTGHTMLSGEVRCWIGRSCRICAWKQSLNSTYLQS